MLDIGWSELLIIGVVALIVVGPKDLPKMFRTLGQVTGKARAMAREFQRAMDAAADDVGVKGIKDAAQSLRETASGKTLRDAVGFDDLDRDMRGIGKGLEADRGGDRQRRNTAKAARDDGAEKSAPAPAGSGADPELSESNARFTHTEAERLKRAERTAAARQQAAEIRARRAAAAETAGTTGAPGASTGVAAPDAPRTAPPARTAPEPNDPTDPAPTEPPRA